MENPWVTYQDDFSINLRAIWVFPDPPSPWSRKMCCLPMPWSKYPCILSRITCLPWKILDGEGQLLVTWVTWDTGTSAEYKINLGGVLRGVWQSYWIWQLHPCAPEMQFRELPQAYVWMSRYHTIFNVIIYHEIISELPDLILVNSDLICSAGWLDNFFETPTKSLRSSLQGSDRIEHILQASTRLGSNISLQQFKLTFQGQYIKP